MCIRDRGLTDDQIELSLKKFGRNVVSYKKENKFFNTVVRVAKDPMMILLLTASAIYFINGKMGDGIFLTIAIVFQTSISLYQYSRSKNAIEKLKIFSQPNCKVIRNGGVVEIRSEEVVVGDSLMVEEGTLIIADGTIIHSLSLIHI